MMSLITNYYKGATASPNERSRKTIANKTKKNNQIAELTMSSNKIKKIFHKISTQNFWLPKLQAHYQSTTPYRTPHPRLTQLVQTRPTLLLPRSRLTPQG